MKFIIYGNLKREIVNVTENILVEIRRVLNMRKISITEALNELKLYDSKITKAITNATFCGAAKKSSDKVGVVKKDDFVERAKASYQSATDLISNRNTLKSAIIRSNAITGVEIDGVPMTVAEAIERKNSIEYDETLLNEMKRQYANATTTVDKENKKVDNKVDELLTTLIGKDSDKKLSKEDQEAVENPYREKNEFKFVDPLELYEKIQALEANIDGFKSNVDTVLVLSNATTFIEVDF